MKARMILTTDCNRSCDHCPNNNVDFERLPVIEKITELPKKYSELIITGGEPMLYPKTVVDIVHRLHEQMPVYLYSALFNEKNERLYSTLISLISGLTYTLHYDCTDREVSNLHELSKLMRFRLKFGDKRSNNRLAIAENLYERYDFSNIDLGIWSVVKKLRYIEGECPLSKDEELVILNERMLVA